MILDSTCAYTNHRLVSKVQAVVELNLLCISFGHFAPKVQRLKFLDSDIMKSTSQLYFVLAPPIV